MSWRKLPLRAADWLPPESNPVSHAGLLSSLPAEHDYECEVEGQLPDLRGTLYRVGPGLYDRGPDRKRMLKLEARMAVAEGTGGDAVDVLEEIVSLDPLDGDADDDGIPDYVDNCRGVANPDQTPSVENPDCGAACVVNACGAPVCSNPEL